MNKDQVLAIYKEQLEEARIGLQVANESLALATAKVQSASRRYYALETLVADATGTFGTMSPKAIPAASNGNKPDPSVPRNLAAYVLEFISLSSGVTPSEVKLVMKESGAKFNKNYPYRILLALRKRKQITKREKKY